MKYLITLVFLLASTAMAEEAEAKRTKKLVLAPVSEETCQQIRAAVAQYGVAIVEAGAAARGYTRAQINQVKASCK